MLIGFCKARKKNSNPWIENFNSNFKYAGNQNKKHKHWFDFGSSLKLRWKKNEFRNISILEFLFSPHSLDVDSVNVGIILMFVHRHIGKNICNAIAHRRHIKKKNEPSQFIYVCNDSVSAQRIHNPNITKPLSSYQSARFTFLFFLL